MPFLPGLMALDDDGFRRRFGKSAVARTRRRGLLRNAAVVLGNSGNRDAVAVLARSLADEIEPLVRSHAAWALGQLGGAGARAALERCRRAESDQKYARRSRPRWRPSLASSAERAWMKLGARRYITKMNPRGPAPRYRHFTGILNDPD